MDTLSIEQVAAFLSGTTPVEFAEEHSVELPEAINVFDQLTEATEQAENALALIDEYGITL